MAAIQCFKQDRVSGIDGLRGVAAMGVVCFHLSANSAASLQDLLPGWLILIFRHGYLGVPVFFVISGFVIALSVGDHWVNGRFFVNFMLRRFIRLNPVYWASILFSFVLLTFQNTILKTHDPFPSGWGLAAHMFYLQDLFAVKPIISVVYWTLCIEVQLYVFYLLVCLISQRLGLLTGISLSWIHSVVFGLAGLYSLLVDQGLLFNPMAGLFVSNWHYFLLGILLSQAYKQGGGCYYILFAWIYIEISALIFINLKIFTLAGLFTSLLIVGNWRYNFMEGVLGSRWVQYLGAISYPLYLVHPEIGWKVISLGKHLMHDRVTPFMAGVLFSMGILSSIGVAHVFHMVIEKPAWGLKLRLR